MVAAARGRAAVGTAVGAAAVGFYQLKQMDPPGTKPGAENLLGGKWLVSGMAMLKRKVAEVQQDLKDPKTTAFDDAEPSA